MVKTGKTNNLATLRNQRVLLGLIQVTIVVLLMIVGAKINLDLPLIPFTLQTYFLCLCALLFAPVQVFGGLMFYLFLGLYFPVFAGDQFGVDVLTGNTAGYLFAFPMAGVLLSALARNKRFISIVLLTFSAQLLIMGMGALYLFVVHSVDAEIAFKHGFLVFLPGAAIKGILASFTYLLLLRVLPILSDPKKAEDLIFKRD